MLSNLQELNTTLDEIVRVAHSQIVILQGAPDNEGTRLINSVARSLPIAHQGLLLESAREYLAQRGFGAITLRRICATLSFPEEDISQRCNAAADFLFSLWHHDHCQRKEMEEIIGHRLRLLFKGHEDSVGFNMVALIATRL